MEKLKQELFALFKEKGAVLMGVADLSDLPASPYPAGICIALPVPRHIAEDLKTAPTREYYEMYHSHNEKLNDMAEAGAALLRERGYHALANTTAIVKTDESLSTALPHKTVATRAGLGWIGKSGLLVTEKYGGALRMSVLLTDAPLPADTPITESRCGDCRRCVEACPAHAISGKNWTSSTKREELVDVFACNKTIRARMAELYGFEFTICGKCFAICPYTQRYLNNH